MDRETSTCLRKRSITAWSESGLHCEYIFKCFLTVGRIIWRIYIHELFDFGLCCMESFSSLASIRKLLKFVAALSKYMYMISLMILFTQAGFHVIMISKTTYVKCDMDINKFAMRFGGLKKYCNKDIKIWSSIFINNVYKTYKCLDSVVKFSTVYSLHFTFVYLF